MPLTLTKGYREAAEALRGLIEGATLTEGTDGEAAIITVEGEGEWWPLDGTEAWGGHLRFVVRDTAARDDDEQEYRRELAGQVPELAGLLTATTTLLVYKRIHYVREITTWEDGRYRGQTEEEGDKWREVTEEFAKTALGTIELARAMER